MNLSEALATPFKLAGTEVQGRQAFHKSMKAGTGRCSRGSIPIGI